MTANYLLILFTIIIFFRRNTTLAKNLIYDVQDQPKFSNLVVFAFQQLLAILAATIAVPTIIGIPTKIPAAILGAGIGGLTIQIPYAIAENGMIEKTIQITSIGTALILGIVTNAILSKIEKGGKTNSGEGTSEQSDEEASEQTANQ